MIVMWPIVPTIVIECALNYIIGYICVISPIAITKKCRAIFSVNCRSTSLLNGRIMMCQAAPSLTYGHLIQGEKPNHTSSGVTR